MQGGSTAAGFPYGRFGSLQGMLEQRFKRTYPHKNIEVINTAMAAVNSYTLMDFVDEIIEIEPDLILIYAGHNEYLGVMGVGSTFAAIGGRSATLAFCYLKTCDCINSFKLCIHGGMENYPKMAMSHLAL
ncbi:SGNH/GDSL hydrolase family protein [Psychrosphaera algicola]|uniref:SGNH/GDSL hydrolase family protein n=1 Tax=Psychrosphaera algicola TaxID=3023714 RepID=A0ABT5FE14_9GAMM|nr:SGNH/GDSL hydrolase family protein [Psychrosphaera sp. G1-22]MDC2888862.1 SGNH/GDSL hydrolase family protein [Psychrosphaera sp. G1-22]